MIADELDKYDVNRPNYSVYYRNCDRHTLTNRVAALHVQLIVVAERIRVRKVTQWTEGPAVALIDTCTLERQCVVLVILSQALVISLVVNELGINRLTVLLGRVFDLIVDCELFEICKEEECNQKDNHYAEKHQYFVTALSV